MRWLLLLLCASGCGLFGSADDGGTNTTGGTSGFGAPTLEVTVNGAHIGPVAPDSASSYVDLINQYDGNSQLTNSSLQIVASSAALGASCVLSVDRYGQFVTSFGVGQYTLSGAGLNGTDDGVAEVQGAPTVSTQQGSWTCTGSDCAAVGLSLSWIDATHAEGYFSGSLTDVSAGSAADVVCAFYLPTRTFSP